MLRKKDTEFNDTAGNAYGPGRTPPISPPPGTKEPDFALEPEFPLAPHLGGKRIQGVRRDHAATARHRKRFLPWHELRYCPEGIGRGRAAIRVRC